MQALILAGGEGTRLRPLTSTVPKPVVPLVDRPFIAFMLEWLRGHGVDDVVLSCGHLAAGVRNVLGDGAAFGVRLRYVEEPEPLGTGGAVKYAEALLDERFLMLNGDVLTDIDLTAQIAAHERTARAGTLALIGVPRTRRPTASCAPTATARSPSSSRSRPPTRSTRTSSPPAPTCSSARCSSSCPTGEPLLDRARRLPAARRRRASYGYAGEGYWLDIGTPERYLRATFDILEGRGRDRRRSTRVGDDYLHVADGVERLGRIIPPALVEAGCRIGAGAHVGAARRARRRRDRRAAAGRRAGRRARAAREIGEDCVAARRIVGAGARDRRRLPRRGRGGARRGRDDRPGQRCSPPARGSSPASSCPRGRSGSERTSSRERPGRRGRRRPASSPTSLAIGRPPARRAVARRVGARSSPTTRPAGSSSPAWAARRIGGAARRRRARRPALAADRRGPRLRAAVLGDAGHDRAVLELLGQHRGDARRLRGGRPPRRPARSSPRPAASSPSAPAPTACPVIPLPAALQPRAAVAYMTVAALEVAGAVRRRRARAHRDRRGRRRASSAWSPSGGPTAPSDNLAARLARGLHGTIPVIAGAGLTDPDRLPLEDADQREREDARVRPRAARARPQRDRRLGGRRRARARSPPSSSTTPTCTRARRQRIELTRGLIASEATTTFRVESRGETRVERRLLARPARRPRLALPRRAARRRPEPVEIIERLKGELARG